MRHVPEVDPPPLKDLLAKPLLNEVLNTLLCYLDSPLMGGQRV